MSKQISLFSGYNQAENRTTNYCLLLLKLLYEENPKFLSGALARIVDDTLADKVGVRFLQQQKKAASIPDGLIVQRPFTIYIETKNSDWFYDSQLEKHLAALSREGDGLKVLIALANFEEDLEERFDRLKALCETKYAGRVLFSALGFEQFADALDDPSLPKNLKDTVSEFRKYLEDEGLLSSWERRLDVINCAGLPDEVVRGNVYMCPATEGAYSHVRSKYFGMYRNKNVEQVAEIEAVVDLDETAATLLWKNNGKPKGELISKAKEKHKVWREGQFPTRVFVLGNLHPTSFIKDSKGGMVGSKQYFDVGRLGAESAADLAAKLKGRKWSEKLQ